MHKGDPIYLDDVDTWPADFRAIALDAKQLAIDFHTIRNQTMRRRWDGDLTADREVNPHGGAYATLLSKLERLLTPHRLVVYHCTRLTPTEADEIRAQGIRLLSQELVHQRLNGALTDGHISAVDHASLKNDRGSIARIEQTKGRWWGCPVRSILKDRGVSPFFRTWGGEGVFFHLEAREILPRLRLVGMPYIVVAGVPHGHFPLVAKPLAERFMACLLVDDLDNVEPPPDFDFRTENPLEPVNVIDLVDYRSPRFKEWTQWQSWPLDDQPKV
jgi:hypothetical protein